MGKKRYDLKGRPLNANEYQNTTIGSRKYGQYRYRHPLDNGGYKEITSWTLNPSDPVPATRGQQKGESLREKEKQIRSEIDRGKVVKGQMTLCALVKRYIAIKSPDVRESTKAGYRTVEGFLETDPFGKLQIRSILPAEAIEWFDKLHKQGKNYSSLHTIRGILRPAFRFAIDNEWCDKNPFDFPMNKRRYGGTKTREAISKADMRRFLDFVRTSKVYNKYFNGIYILFNTGLRISEFCGLTPDDIDFAENVIHVRRQLIRIHDGVRDIYYIEAPKTENGVRDVPMLPGVANAFREVLELRAARDIAEYDVWDHDHTESATKFMWVDKDGRYEVAMHWENHFRWAVQRYNKIYKNQLPAITPHVCRHTFCSNCASSGMNPKTLQMIMGHSSVEITMDVYTHLDAGNMKSAMQSLVTNKQYDVYPWERKPDITAPTEDE